MDALTTKAALPQTFKNIQTGHSRQRHCSFWKVSRQAEGHIIQMSLRLTLHKLGPVGKLYASEPMVKLKAVGVRALARKAFLDSSD